MKEISIYIKTGNIIEDARQIIERARSNAVRSVDFCRVQMYWNLGRRILEEEQEGKERADYGAYIVKKLAKNLEVEYGSGFGVRQIERARQFYRLYPIASAVRTQLNWMQYKLLIAISDPDKREFYELESLNNCWTGRETERQINSQLYERLLLSNDKETILAIARRERIPETPQEIIKEPMLLELRPHRKLPDENPTIGILLCTSKNDTVVKMTLPQDNKTILPKEYQIYLPTSEQLAKEVNEAKQIAEETKKQ